VRRPATQSCVVILGIEKGATMRRHDYEKEAALRNRAGAEPIQPQAHTELGAWLARAGRLSQAREALRTGLGRAGGSARIHHLLGLILAGAGDYASAMRHLERAAEQEPTRYDFLRDLALVQGAAGRTASSVESLHQAIGLGGEAAADLEWLRRLGEKALAESGARAERRPPQPPRHAALVERIVARDPEVAEALVSHPAKTGTDERETLRAARRALVRLAAQHPSYPDLHFGLSLIAEQLGEIDRAIEAAEKALAINPRYVEACLLAARLYQKSGKPAAAEAHCRRAAELRPQWIDTHLRLGHLLGEQGRTGEAAEAYRKALQINAQCEEARRGLETLAAAPAAGGGGA